MVAGVMTVTAAFASSHAALMITRQAAVDPALDHVPASTIGVGPKASSTRIPTEGSVMKSIDELRRAVGWERSAGVLVEHGERAEVAEVWGR
jgi:hypothetical protein